ncbi:MAG: AzlD domain-containing protein [Clostridia bacterium]|nr:AzlD domain-containing protein [Clostridia bacterium]
MPNVTFIPLLLVMVFTTYLIRMLPFVLFNRKIKNKRIKAFFDYIPYSVLSAMTFPAIFYSTGTIYSAIVGTIIALFLSFKNKSLLIVAIGACLGALIVEILIKFI